MTTHENATPPPDWTPPTGRHCGDFCWGAACTICGEYVIAIPPNIELGAE